MIGIFGCSFDHLSLNPDDLQNPDESCELHKFVKSSNPRDSHHLVQALLQKQIKRQNGDQVYREPPSQILLGYLASLLDQNEVLVVVRCVENYHDVDKEHQIDGKVRILPAPGWLLEEG